MPANAARLNQVREYLIHERGIAPELVEAAINEGTLYANSYGSCYFLHRTPAGEVTGSCPMASGELRNSGA